MTLYSFVDDGKDPALASKPFEGHKRTYVTGNGSIHFPEKEDGDPYISYENNTSMKYIDGEVVKGKFIFTDMKYDSESRNFKGTITYAKKLQVVDPMIVSLDEKFDYQL